MGPYKAMKFPCFIFLCVQVLSSFCIVEGLGVDDIQHLEVREFLKSNDETMKKIFNNFGDLLHEHFYSDIYRKAQIASIVHNITDDATPQRTDTENVIGVNEVCPPVPVPGLKICIINTGTEICLSIDMPGPGDPTEICVDIKKDCPFDLTSLLLPPSTDSLQNEESLRNMDMFGLRPEDIVSTTETPVNTIGNITTECFLTELQFVLDLVCTPLELYAFQMFDAMGKIPSGLLKGDLRWLGSFLQCRDIEDVNVWIPFAEPNSTYNGKYCLSTWDLAVSDVTLPLQIGVCMPDVCSSEDVSNLLKLGLGLIIGDALQLQWTYCDYDKPLDTGAKTILLILFIVIGLVVIGSIVDYFTRVRYQKEEEDSDGYDMSNTAVAFNAHDNPTYKTNDDIELKNTKGLESEVKDEVKEEKMAQEDIGKTIGSDDDFELSKTAKVLSPLRAFSGFINGSKLFSTEYEDNELTIKAVHGMRVLSLWWVIYQLTYETSYEVLENPLDLLWISERLFSQGIGNGRFATDTFFVISGLLITYLALKELEENGSSWKMWLTYYFHRVWRFWPAYIFVLLWYMWLMPYMVGGPMEYIAQDYVEPCYENWWTNVIFINNLYPYFDSMRSKCMPWSWYIACVMQFYIISPFIILAIHWKAIVGFIIVGLLFIMDFTCTAMISSYYGLTASPGQSRFNDNADDNPFGDYIDGKPHTRIAAYLVGMCLAYIIIKHQEGKFKVTKPVSILCWIVSTFLGIAIVYCTYGTYHEPYWSQSVTVFYLTVSRFTFSLAIAWVIFACVTDHGGLVNTFLSWNFWLPLSRMSFCTYLMAPIMMAFWLLNNNVQPFVSDYNFMYLFCAYLGISYLMGFTIALIVERPFMQLERLMFGKGLEVNTPN